MQSELLTAIRLRGAVVSLLLVLTALGLTQVGCSANSPQTANSALPSTVTNHTDFDNASFHLYQYEITLTEPAMLKWEWDEEFVTTQKTGMALSPGTYSLKIFRNFDGEKWVGFDFISGGGNGGMGQLFQTNQAFEFANKKFNNLLSDQKVLQHQKETALLSTADGNRLCVILSE